MRRSGNRASANALPEQPIPRHLSSMLDDLQAAASGGGDMPVLEALADTIRRELCFQVVAVNLLNDDGRRSSGWCSCSATRRRARS